jgi:hypothetical protein
MNAFVRHHRASIRFGYSCFDRILCRAAIQAFQHPGGIACFLRHHRQAKALTPSFLRNISSDYHRWLTEKAAQRGVPVVEPPTDPRVRREDWVEPYYQQLGQRCGTAVILKCRERARVAISLPSQGNHLELAWRFVNLYYFYRNDPQCGRLFLRLCPYFPFNGQVCLNGHEWLARQLDREGIAYCKRENSFVECADPQRLQELADAFNPEDLLQALNGALEDWLAFFTPAEQEQGYRHHLYVTQVEYCHNLIFSKQAALHRLFERLLDHNRSIGHPEKLAYVFARRSFRPDTRTGETRVKITSTRTQVLSSRFKSTSLKQYVRDKVLLRTESASYQLQDLSLRKNVHELPRMRQVLAQANERYLDVQQDVLVSTIDRGQMEQLRRPSVSSNGRRTPGLHCDDLRLIAVLQALLNFVHLVGKGCFRTAALLADVQLALDRPDYRLSQLRYDLGKLRGKDLVMRLPKTQLYQLSPKGYRVAILYCKLYHRLYAPLLAGFLDPFADDGPVPDRRRAKLDRLYNAVDEALAQLTEQIGLSA